MKTVYFIFYLLLFSSFYHSQNYKIRSFQENDNLSDPFVYSINQNYNGLLFVTTGKGLQSFDGQFFSSISGERTEDEILYSTAVTPASQLWFGSFNGTLYSYTKKHNTLKRFSQKVNGSINKILPFSAGNGFCLFSKGDALYTTNGKKLNSVSSTRELQINDAELINDSTAIAACEEGLYSISLTSNTFEKIAEDNISFRSIQKLKNNTFLCLKNDENIILFYLLTPNKIKIQHSISKQDIDIQANINSVFLHEKNNDLFISCGDEKLSVYNLSTNELKTFTEQEFNADVSCYFSDSENNIWIGTPGKGLYRLTRMDYDFIEIDNQAVFSIAEDADQHYYFGTNQGIYIADKNYKKIKEIHNFQSKKLGKVSALHFQRNQLWIGTEKNGLIIFNPKDGTVFYPEFSSISTTAINSISGKNNRIVVSTNLDGVFIYSGSELKQHFSVTNGLLHNNVNHAIITQKDRILYATHNTSFNYSKENELFEIDLKANGLSTDFNFFAEDSNGNVYIATNGDGVYILEDLKLELLPCNQNLKSKYCGSVILDQQQNLWIVQSQNIYRCFLNNQKIQNINLHLNDPFNLNAKASFLTKQGDLLFGTDKNIFIFHPNSEPDKLPLVYLSSLKINDSICTLQNSLKLASGKYDMEFIVSAMCLKNSEDITFSYLLEGRDKEWIELNQNRKISVPQLSEGNYTLKVKAINAAGFSNEIPFEFSFKIDKPFWKKSWFWILTLVGLILFIYLIVRIRTSHLLRLKIELEKKVAEKTIQLQAEKEQVVESKKRIEEQNEEILDSITYAKRIQQALLTDNNLIHQYKNNLFVFYQPRDIVSGDFYWMAEINSYKIIVAADCTGHGVPGALMSMVGSTLLNKIILERKITQPKKILESLDEEIKLALKQYNDDATRDGMDVCLVCIDEKRAELIYAGAMRPLFQVRDKTLIEYEATKHAIGGYSYGKTKEFSETKITLHRGDRFYLFSDGYADQFGGEKGKKFMLKNFKSLLLSSSDLEMQNQKDLLSATYNSWKGVLPQIDDVMVIGIKI